MHDYLVMNLDISQHFQVKLSMNDYIKFLVTDSPEDVASVNSTPMANHPFIFKIEKLNMEEKKFFLHFFAKILFFVSKFSRSDIHTVVAFLTTRMTKPDEDNYKRLSKMNRSLRVTLNMTLNMSAINTEVVQWWINTSFAVHNDMRSFTSGILIFSHGAV